MCTQGQHVCHMKQAPDAVCQIRHKHGLSQSSPLLRHVALSCFSRSTDSLGLQGGEPARSCSHTYPDDQRD
jgi:hypothetical protein